LILGGVLGWPLYAKSVVGTGGKAGKGVRVGMALGKGRSPSGVGVEVPAGVDGSGSLMGDIDGMVGSGLGLGKALNVDSNRFSRLSP
jgi:hypothetical protein